jgi:hypothetical protein
MMILLIPFAPLIAPPLMLFTLITLVTFASGIHPMICIAIILGLIIGLWRAFGWLLSLLSVKLTSIAMSVWFAVSYTIDGYGMCHKDVIWASGIGAFGAWIGWKVGRRLAIRAHYKAYVAQHT